MKTDFVAIGLVASFASLVVASPAADAKDQLMGREPVLCIGCISAGNCAPLSEPDGCESDPDSCTLSCFDVPAGCRCCNVVDGTLDDTSCYSP